MGIRVYKPTSAARRFTSVLTFEELTRKAPEKSLLAPLKKHAGRNAVSYTHLVSKGHGYSGVVQRWNQHTGPMKHGSKYHRGVGSMSANSDPSRVFKNKHMPGQYGHENVTVLTLEVVRVDAEDVYKRQFLARPQTARAPAIRA